jgi:hypothetical protein
LKSQLLEKSQIALAAEGSKSSNDYADKPTKIKWNKQLVSFADESKPKKVVPRPTSTQYPPPPSSSKTCLKPPRPVSKLVFENQVVEVKRIEYLEDYEEQYVEQHVSQPPPSTPSVLASTPKSKKVASKASTPSGPARVANKRAVTPATTKSKAARVKA